MTPKMERFRAAHPGRLEELKAARHYEMCAERRAQLAALKMAVGCADCGYRAHAVALHFDHVRGIKKFNIAQGMDRSLSAIMEELSKCEVRCANCHMIVTDTRRRTK